MCGTPAANGNSLLGGVLPFSDGSGGLAEFASSGTIEIVLMLTLLAILVLVVLVINTQVGEIHEEHFGDGDEDDNDDGERQIATSTHPLGNLFGRDGGKR